VLQLRLIAERRRLSLLSLGVLEEALAELSHRESRPSEETMNWLAELLVDRDAAIQESVLMGIPDTYLQMLVPDVLQTLRDSDSVSFVQLACRRLVKTGTPADSEAIRLKLTEWLRSHDLGKVEAALVLTGDLACSWAADEVYARGLSVDLPDYLQPVAQHALELLNDPRSGELAELQPQGVEEVMRLDVMDQSPEEAFEALSAVEGDFHASDMENTPNETEVT